MSQPTTITVRTGSRLHFGLWAWGAEHARQFGGVGMMIDRPAFALQFSQADKLEAIGPGSERVERFAQHVLDYWGTTPTDLPLRIEVLDIPREHVGLGVGTQLGLSVARGVAEWMGKADVPADELARAAGRGLRSAVGTHGFLQGGLLVDAGKSASDTVGQLATRVTVPDAWRVLLVIPKSTQGLAGEREAAAFHSLPPVPEEVTHNLQQLTLDRLVPAAERGDFDIFSQAIFEYGHQAGLCFESIQGGPYSSAEIARVVEQVRSLGIAGTGQSSWGPTVFAFCESGEHANHLRGHLEGDHEIVIAKPRNAGAVVEDE